jgi:ERCC4-related helicase
MEAPVTLNVSKEIINPIVEQHIKSAVLEAFGGSSEVINKVVTSIITQKCTNDGNISQYQSDNIYSWIDVVLTKNIQNMVREKIEAIIKDQSSKITEILIAKLKTQKGASMVAESLLSAFSDTLKKSWRSTINVELKSFKND